AGSNGGDSSRGAANSGAAQSQFYGPADSGYPPDHGMRPSSVSDQHARESYQRGPAQPSFQAHPPYEAQSHQPPAHHAQAPMPPAHHARAPMPPAHHAQPPTPPPHHAKARMPPAYHAQAPQQQPPLPVVRAPQPVAISLPEAVKAAHTEGYAFGESVGREAPGLWLEAVLARKPRMPSDL